MPSRDLPLFWGSPARSAINAHPFASDVLSAVACVEADAHVQTSLTSAQNWRSNHTSSTGTERPSVIVTAPRWRIAPDMSFSFTEM